MLSYDKALALMRRGSTMMKTYAGHNIVHYVAPGGEVSMETAHKLKNVPGIIPGNDGTWPGLDQTWQVRKPDAH